MALILLLTKKQYIAAAVYFISPFPLLLAMDTGPLGYNVFIWIPACALIFSLFMFTHAGLLWTEKIKTPQRNRTILSIFTLSAIALLLGIYYLLE